MGALGIHNVNYSGGAWAQCSCPLAPFTHKGGRDSRPSFGVSVGEERSHYNCFVCSSGTLEALLGDLEMRARGQTHTYDFAAARLFLAEESKIAVLPPYEEFVPSPYKAFEAWPEWWIEQYPTWSGVAKYLYNERNLDFSTCEHFGLRWDARREMVIAPVRTADGVLAGARGRYIGKDETALKHYDYEHRGIRNTHLVWFNEPAFNLDGPLLLVEGQFDAMRVWRHHPKVIALLSSKTTPFKMKKVYGQREVVLMLDNDQTGRRKVWGGDGDEFGLVHDLQRRGIRVAVVEYPTTDESDPAYFKDAGAAPELWLAETFGQLEHS